MIQENAIWILFIISPIILLIIYFYFDLKKTKVENKIHFDFIYNQITKEKILKEHYKKEAVKVDVLTKHTNQKLLTVKTSIITIDESLKGIFK